MRDGLVTVEVTLTVVLLIAAGLLLQSYANLLRAPRLQSRSPADRRDRAAALDYNRRRRQRTAFYESVLQRVRAMPSVAGAEYANYPLLTFKGGRAVLLDRRAAPPPTAEADRNLALDRVITDGYLEALGVPLVRGTPPGSAGSQRRAVHGCRKRALRRAALARSRSDGAANQIRHRRPRSVADSRWSGRQRPANGARCAGGAGGVYPGRSGRRGCVVLLAATPGRSRERRSRGARVIHPPGRGRSRSRRTRRQHPHDERHLRLRPAQAQHPDDARGRDLPGWRWRWRRSASTGCSPTRSRNAFRKSACASRLAPSQDASREWSCAREPHWP